VKIKYLEMIPESFADFSEAEKASQI